MIKIGSIPIFYKQLLGVEINQSRKNPYLLQCSPRRIYRLYFLVRRVPTIGTRDFLFSLFLSPFLLLLSLFLSLFLSFLSLFFFLLIYVMLLPSSTNESPPLFIHLPTCMHGDTWLAMCPTCRYFDTWLAMLPDTNCLEKRKIPTISEFNKIRLGNYVIPRNIL